ncbi:MAG: PAS domain-containing protein [Pseudomonadota bacterium]
MRSDFKHQLGSLAESFDSLAHAVTVSDLSKPDHPLVYLNKAFTKMTGFGEEMLGHNCRFLQSDLENTEARAHIRTALEANGRCELVLKNRHRNGDEFYNMLLIDTVRGYKSLPPMAIGSQFDLGPEGVEQAADCAVYTTQSQSSFSVPLTVKMRLERRRLYADAVERMFRSWCTLKEVSSRS